ncbi:hypothetical protein JD969_15540 [Planctomycetota bacterium]|nr:hypothetical protein JD969_15540 [Planctomycetota bacterium]
MHRFTQSLGIALALVIPLTMPLQAEPTNAIAATEIANVEESAAYLAGVQHIHKAEYERARDSFKKAVDEQPGNAKYKKNYAKIHNIIRMQEKLATEQDPDRWMKMANSLRIFYTNVGHGEQLLDICTQMRERDNTPTTTNVLSEALIKVGNYSEAEQMLDSVVPEERSRINVILRGLAVTHQGRKDEGEAVLEELAKDEKVSMGLLFRIARLQALLKHDADAAESMTTIFKSAPQKSHAGLTRVINKTAEFQRVLKDPAFKTALATKSERPEKKDDCSTCPNRKTCKEREEKESCDGGDCEGDSCDK